MSDPTTPLPPGARYKGSRRRIAGIILLILLIPMAITGIKDDGLNALGPLALFAATGVGLYKVGSHLRAKKIIVQPKSKSGHTDKSASARNATSLTPLADAIDMYGENSRVKLYSMDSHADAVRMIAMINPINRHSGVTATWGDVIPDPLNPVDPHAIQVWVDGQAVGYFALDWKDYAHQQVRINHGAPTRIPVVVRWMDDAPLVWAFSSMDEAEGFTDWIIQQDR